MNINEETKEGNGFKTAKNLGLNISKAMAKATTAKNSTPGVRSRGALGAITHPIHRRFFGIRSPGQR